MQPIAPVIVFKIVSAADWKHAEQKGSYTGSADDRRDGFIHLSSAAQTRGTVARHFSAREDLVIVAVSAPALGETLRWELSRDGEPFPHVYGELPLASVLWVQPLPLGRDGRHHFPEGIP